MYKNNKLISIVTVVYNSKDDIENTILSVKNQLFRDIEYIIIDGGSTDGTKEIIEKYRKIIDIFISEKDNGIYDAMNKALKYVTGDFVYFLNSGDYFYDNQTLEKVSKYLVKNRDKVVYGRVLYFRGNEKYISSKKMNHRNLFDGFSLHHQGMFVPSNFYRIVGGFDINYKIGSDAITTYRIKLLGYDFLEIPLIIAKYNMFGASSKNSIIGKLEHYFGLYFLGIWDFEKFKDKITKYKIENNINDLYDYVKHLTILNNNIKSILEMVESGNEKNDILIVNDDKLNPFNENLKKIFNLKGLWAKFSAMEFFLKVPYRVLILEWENYLLNDRFYPLFTKFEEKIEKLKTIFQYYKTIGTKIYVIIHNELPHHLIKSEEKSKDKSKEIEYQKFIYSNCDGIIHLGKYSVELFRKNYNDLDKKHFIVFHPLYTNYWTDLLKENIRKKLKIKENDFVVLSIGAIRNQDEINVLESIFDKISVDELENYSNFSNENCFNSLEKNYSNSKSEEDKNCANNKKINKRLIIAGKIEKNVKIRKDKNIVVINKFLNKNEIAELLKIADCMVVPRIYSLNSGTLILALSYKKVVIGPENGNMEEILKDFGMFTFPKDILKDFFNHTSNNILNEKSDATKKIELDRYFNLDFQIGYYEKLQKYSYLKLIETFDFILSDINDLNSKNMLSEPENEINFSFYQIKIFFRRVVIKIFNLLNKYFKIGKEDNNE